MEVRIASQLRSLVDGRSASAGLLPETAKNSGGRQLGAAAAASPGVQDIATLSLASVVRGQLANLVRAGGAMSFVSTDASPFTRTDAAPGTYLDLPFDAQGLPDYAAVRVSGGTVTGGVPGGFDISGWHDGRNSATFFAAEVTQKGQAAQFVKGMRIEVSSSASEADRRQFIEGAAAYFDRLPSNAAEARRQAAQQLPTFIAKVG